MGLVVDIFQDIYLPDLSKKIMIDVKFGSYDIDTFSPSELELIEPSE